MLPVLAPHVLEEVVLGRDRPPSAPGGRHLAGGVLALPHGRAPRDLLDLVVQGPAVEGEAEDLRKVQLALGPEPVACARKATPGVGVEHRPARASAPVHVVGHRGQVDVRRGEDVADEERPVHGAARAPVGADGLPIARQPRPYLCQRLGDGPGRANRPGLGAHQLPHAPQQVTGRVRGARGGSDTTGDLLRGVGELMSAKAGPVRSARSIAEALAQVRAWLAGYRESVSADGRSRRAVVRMSRTRNVRSTAYVYLSAMADYVDRGGRSRGSVLYTDAGGGLPRAGHGLRPERELNLPEVFRFSLDGGALDDQVQEVAWRPPMRERGPRRPGDVHLARSAADPGRGRLLRERVARVPGAWRRPLTGCRTWVTPDRVRVRSPRRSTQARQDVPPVAILDGRQH